MQAKEEAALKLRHAAELQAQIAAAAEAKKRAAVAARLDGEAARAASAAHLALVEVCRPIVSVSKSARKQASHLE